MGIQFDPDKKVTLSTEKDNGTPKTGTSETKPKYDIGKELLTRYKKLDTAPKPEVKGLSDIGSGDIKFPKGWRLEPENTEPKIVCPTPEEQAARAKAKKEALAELNKKVSSTDISYADANAKMKELEAKYKDCFNEYDVVDPDAGKRPGGNVVYDIAQYKHVKVFDSSKLPEPARTEYKEAAAAKKEIERNNTDLCAKADIDVPEEKLPEMGNITLAGELKRLLEVGTGKAVEPTEKQKAARAKLDAKTSSTGATYKDSKAKLGELTEKYKNNPACQSEFESEQPKDTLKYMAPYTAFDPHKLPEPDKTAYFDALKSVNEIEKKNSALLAQGGLSKTKQPNTKYYDEKSWVIYENNKFDIAKADKYTLE